MIVVVAVVLAGYFLGSWGKRSPWQVTIATGTPGGTYSTLGEEFARILEGLPEAPIDTAKAIPTSASVKNIELLAKDSVDIGFVMKPAISNAMVDQLAKLSVLARIYMDVVQIVVRKDAGIYSLRDLNAKKVYVGKEGSGTKIVAEKILDSLRVSPSIKVKEGSYREASRMLVSEELDAAFFVAGTPTEAVKMALGSGRCDLLDLGDIRDRIIESIPDLNTSDIPVNSYENQTKKVRTISADTFLLCRKNLDVNKVFLIEDALFNNLDQLLIAHAKAQDIHLDSAFVGLPEEIELHKGASRFQKEVEKKLLILTGALGGKYYLLGKTIKSLLEPYGIHTRVSHSDGSRENLKVLRERDPQTNPTLAILQYDVALASLGDPEHVYGVPLPEGTDIPKVRDMRRIATLHQETVHIMVRRDKLTHEKESQPTLEALKNLRVCLGPEGSGTRILANAILTHHDIIPKSRILLPVADMVDRIHSEEIDAGFFVSYVPSIAVKTILDNVEIKLLSITPKKIVNMVGPALDMTEIPQHEYACQLEGETVVKTIETKAVLVARENMPQVEKVTMAIFEGEAFLDIDGGVETMKEDLPSIHLHPDARKYYQKAGYLPSKPPINWLQRVWYILTSTVIIIGGAKSLVEWRRHRSRNGIGRKILDIEITPEAGAKELEALMNIRQNILERVQLRWWMRGELNKGRWQYLDDLIERRIRIMRDNLVKEVLKEIYAVKEDAALDSAARLEGYDALEVHIRDYFEKGELDKSGYEFLIGIFENLKTVELS
ncbi:MAG: TAXI family TRAP transporter solute-binding subunit [Fidelibacterota bacterium]|nr:MAG: TAXI family TRAP transporter solute-binding subunit [Candidatus Neomarinimicrobiota bacterium]